MNRLNTIREIVARRKAEMKAVEKELGAIDEVTPLNDAINFDRFISAESEFALAERPCDDDEESWVMALLAK